MKPIILAFLLAWSMVVSGLSGSSIAKSEERRAFSVSDIRGSYGFTFDGMLLNRNDSTSIPIAAVGRLRADGKGLVPILVRTLNVGGEVQRNTAQGTYTVNPDGTGVAQFRVETQASAAALLPTTVERFEFVIDRKRQVLQFIGVALLGPNGEDVGLSLVLRGEARRQ